MSETLSDAKLCRELYARLGWQFDTGYSRLSYELCAKVRAKMDRDQAIAYIHALHAECLPTDPHVENWHVFNATAQQQARAIIAAMPTPTPNTEPK